MIQLKRILVPTDFSEHSEHAASYAAELARRFEVDEVHCVHVSDVPADLMATFGYYLTGPSEQFIDQIRDESRRSLDEFAKQHLPDLPVETAFLEGRPFVEIIRYARAKDVGLIVIATHGRTGLTHALFGSVAEKVVRKAPCPVLVVKRQEQEFVLP